MNEITTDKPDMLVPDKAANFNIRNLVYMIRGQQVMLDSDLAALYQVETKYFNRAVGRNIERFPEDFRFMLTKDEYDGLRCQIVTSNSRGGRRFLPYAFTEQGISMLASILHSEVAVQTSIKIMRAFSEMKRFIANNAMLFEKISSIELKQLEYQKSTDERFDRVFQYIDDHAETEQKIFFDGQIYDAFSLLISLVRKAEKEIILVDGYVDINTLNILSKKNKDVKVICYTYESAPLSAKDIAVFNAQYPLLSVRRTQVFHDRFLIVDGAAAYHVGASLKDAGKKCFGISRLEDPIMVQSLITRLEAV